MKKLIFILFFIYPISVSSGYKGTGGWHHFALLDGTFSSSCGRISIGKIAVGWGGSYFLNPGIGAGMILLEGVGADTQGDWGTSGYGSAFIEMMVPLYHLVVIKKPKIGFYPIVFYSIFTLNSWGDWLDPFEGYGYQQHFYWCVGIDFTLCIVTVGIEAGGLEITNVQNETKSFSYIGLHLSLLSSWIVDKVVQEK